MILPDGRRFRAVEHGTYEWAENSYVSDGDMVLTNLETGEEISGSALDEERIVAERGDRSNAAAAICLTPLRMGGYTAAIVLAQARPAVRGYHFGTNRSTI